MPETTTWPSTRSAAPRPDHRDGLDLDQRLRPDQPGDLHAGRGGVGVAEELATHCAGIRIALERGVVVSGLYDVVIGRSGRRQDRAPLPEDLPRLRADVAGA